MNPMYISTWDFFIYKSNLINVNESFEIYKA